MMVDVKSPITEIWTEEENQVIWARWLGGGGVDAVTSIHSDRSYTPF